MGHFNPATVVDVPLIDQKALEENAARARKAAEEAEAKRNQELQQSSSVSERLQGRFGSSPTDLQRDLISGSQFGESVLGEGLGRLQTSEQVQLQRGRLDSLREGFQEQAKGLTSKEATALRERGLSNIGAQGQSSQRALQAALARAGVKGGAAGAQLGQQALGTLQQKANLERDLILENVAAKERGLSNLAGFEQGRLAEIAGMEQFDIGQAAKEKSIVTQGGLGFAALGAAERGAKLSADASLRSAQASSGGGGKK